MSELICESQRISGLEEALEAPIYHTWSPVSLILAHLASSATRCPVEQLFLALSGF
jgi:hypothetical protein